MAAKDPRWHVRPNGLNDTPQYKVDIDREKANALGVTAAAIDQTFSIAWASVREQLPRYRRPDQEGVRAADARSG